jgi:hypothetical protein
MGPVSRTGVHAALAVDVDDVLELGDVLAHDIDGLVGVGAQVIQVRVLGAAQGDQRPALVLHRRQFRFCARIQEEHAAEHNGGKQQDRRTVMQRGVEAAGISVGDAIIRAFDDAREPALVHIAGQQHRRQHRRKRQRDHTGNDDRARQRERELAEQRAGDAAQQADGRIDGGERDGHGDDRTYQFARADQRRLDGRAPFMDVAVDVLDHHDRVVDHKPHRQHHGQQGEQIDAEAGGEHERRAADDGQRNGEHRNDDGTE